MASGPAISTRALRILHLEDNLRDAAMIRDRLQTSGVDCEIVVTHDRDAFEEAISRDAFDLVLSDYTLPGYDGIAALKHVRSTRPDLPVILVSGTVGEDRAVECLQHGATDYLLKARLERLAPAVLRALAEAETRRERRQAEAALAESEARKGAILDSVLDCIITMDIDGVVVEFNAAAARTFGYTKSEAIGRPLAELIIPPRLREMHVGGIARYLATGSSTLIGRPVEVTAVRSDGTEIPVELSITAIGSGRTSVFTGVLRDITARRQADEAGQQAAANLRRERDSAQGYLDAAEVILLKLDLEGRITLVNRYACAILGWTAEELLGKDWIDHCTPPRLRGEIRKASRDVFAIGTATGEYPILTKSGQEKLIVWRSAVLKDDAGAVAGSLSSGTDITDRSVAAEALRQTEERMRFALQGAEVGIWDMDYASGKLRWSEILEKQNCMAPGSFDGTFEAFVGAVHPDDRAALVEAIGGAMKSGGDFTTLHRIVCPDGSVRWLSGAGRVHRDENLKPIRAVGISLDVTARHVLEEQFQQAQKMEAVGRLAAGVAHDFNNLLTVILGFCSLLLSGLEADDPRHADLMEIKGAGARAADLTRQLLAFSRKEVIQPTLLDLNDIVSEIQPMLGRLIGEDVAVVVELAAEPALVKADRGQVEQMVVNLAVNARDAMPDGGTLTIRTTNVASPPQANAQTQTSGPTVLLTVTDTGTGMTPEVKARLFEPFFTTKGVGKGTGLGLATVHGVVSQSGGRITVESEVGSGTTIKIYFPRAQGGESAAEALPLPLRVSGRRYTVLVVEDEAALRELTKRLLERLGYAVLLASNAEEALLTFDEHSEIDLLLTDVVMPGASGPALVLQLVERQPSLKVVYMSGYTDDAIGHRGVLAPGISFLHKPFSLDTLSEKLREALAQP